MSSTRQQPIEEVKEIKGSPIDSLSTDSIIEIPTSRPPAKAPDLEEKTITVRYLNPDFTSFEEIKSNDWILKPQTENFLLWAEDKERKEDWLCKPNATSDNDLQLVVNGKTVDNSVGRKAKVAFSVAVSTPFTFGKYAYNSTRTINPGEIHFTNNAGKQEIRVEPGNNYLSGIRHSWGSKRKASENSIKEGNIHIVRILPGQIGLATDNGKPIVLLPGRHAYNSALFNLEEKNIVSSNRPIIEFGTISIIRIQSNEIGLAAENNNPILLLPGLHIKNSASFKFISCVNTKNLSQTDLKEEKRQRSTIAESYFEHGTISVVQVANNKIGCAWDGRDSVLLNPGIHIKNSRAFKFEKMVNINEKNIEFNTINIIQVRANEIGLSWDNNVPIILPPGRHEFNSPQFKFQEFKSIYDKKIIHGNYTQICVNSDEYGYAFKNGKAMELTTGIHKFTDPAFIFCEFKKKNEPVVQFANIAHIIVKDNEARAIYKDGSLTVLEKGVHDFDCATLSIVEKPISLKAKIYSMRDIHVTTQDRMPMHVTGQIVYRVKDARTLILGLSEDEVKELDKAIEKRADASLREQFSHVDLSMISPNHHHGNEVKEDKRLMGNSEQSEGDDLRGKLCTRITKKLSKDAEKWGIEILDFEILDVGCQNRDVEASLADATAKTRQAEAKFELQRAQNATDMERERAEVERKLMKEKKQAEINQVQTESERTLATLRVTKEAEAQAEAKKIQSVADSKALEIKMQVEVKNAAYKTEKEAEAKANAILAEAKAKATAIEMEATAKAKARVLEADAEKKAAILQAEGRDALNACELKLYQSRPYLELKKCELEVQRVGKLAQQATPAVLFQGEGSKTAAEKMFLAQGTELTEMSLALQKRQHQFFSRRRNSSPSVISVAESKNDKLQFPSENKLELR